MQRRFELDASQRATRCIPRRSPSRGEPQKPESLCPYERHCSSGPVGHGIRTGRKSRAKVNAWDLAIARDPGELAHRGPSSDFFEHLLSPAMRARRDGARSRACTRPHRWPRHSFRLPPREGQRLSEHLHHRARWRCVRGRVERVILIENCARAAALLIEREDARRR